VPQTCEEEAEEEEKKVEVEVEEEEEEEAGRWGGGIKLKVESGGAEGATQS
jgi:hypothetical protein